MKNIEEFKKMNEEDREEYGKSIPKGWTYDKNENITSKNIKGKWWEKTFNKDGKVLNIINGDGRWSEFTYNDNGLESSMKKSDGYWRKQTWNEEWGKTYYENSEGSWWEAFYDEKEKELLYADEGCYTIQGFDVSKEEYESAKKSLIRSKSLKD